MLYFGLFVIAVLALLGLIYWEAVVYSERETGEAIDSEIRYLSDQYQERGLAGLVETVNDRGDPEHGSGMLYLLTDLGGQPLAGNLSAWPDVRVDPDGWMRFSLEGVRGAGGRDARRHVAQAADVVLQGGYQLLVGRDLADFARYRQRIVLALGWAGAVTLALGFGGGVVMSRAVLRRIDPINRTSAGIVAGDTSRRVPVTGRDDEFDRLAVNLNAMLDRIERLVVGMRQVTDNIAHDLRSPLGRMRSRIELALRDAPSAERYRSELERTVEDADQLLATFNALLDIAAAESGSLDAEMAPLDLIELARGLAELYDPVAEEQGLRLTLTVPPRPVIVIGNRQLLSRMLANLLENSLKYTPEGGLIDLSIEPAAETVALVVCDTGPGIPSEDRERVFDRFVRLESSRTTEGNGLGLSLVRAIARLHGGRITLEDARRPRNGEGPGLRAAITLPIPAGGRNAMERPQS